jgi:O-antigen/teichoic acid export membrane protein
MVTPYQVAYRYFSLAMMLFSIVAIPYWSATTDAYARGDVEWIRRSMRKMHLVLLGIAVLLVVMTLVAIPIYRLWVGSEVVVPMSLSWSMAAYMMIVIFSLSYSYFLNGLNALNLQLLFTVGAALVYIPLAWHLGKTYGVLGIVLALCLVNLPGAVVNMIQYHRIINGRARGLWNPSPLKSNRES